MMNCLEPLTTHSPFSRTALVLVAPASEPAPGSVRPKPASCSPATSVGQPGLLLLVGAVGQDRVDAEADRGLERDAHRLVDATDLLDGQAQRREAAVLAGHPGAAELLGSGEAHQAERAHLLDHVGREVVVAVPLRGVRRDLGLGEVADAAAELLVLGGQLEGHAPHPSGPRLAIANPQREPLWDARWMEVGAHLPQVATSTEPTRRRPRAGRRRRRPGARAGRRVRQRPPRLPPPLARRSDPPGRGRASTPARWTWPRPSRCRRCGGRCSSRPPSRRWRRWRPAAWWPAWARGPRRPTTRWPGIPFDDRWPRFDESVRVLRGLLGGGRAARPSGSSGWPATGSPSRRRPCRCGWPAGAPRPGCGGSPGSATAGSRRRTTPRRRRSPRPGSGSPTTVTGWAVPDLPAAVATMWTWVDDDAARRRTGAPRRARPDRAPRPGGPEGPGVRRHPGPLRPAALGVRRRRLRADPRLAARRRGRPARATRPRRPARRRGPEPVSDARASPAAAARSSASWPPVR